MGKELLDKCFSETDIGKILTQYFDIIYFGRLMDQIQFIVFHIPSLLLSKSSDRSALQSSGSGN